VVEVPAVAVRFETAVALPGPFRGAYAGLEQSRSVSEPESELCLSSPIRVWKRGFFVGVENRHAPASVPGRLSTAAVAVLYLHWHRTRSETNFLISATAPHGPCSPH
jgi:hypothetical protein